jgi:hypothetical protein
MRMVACCAVMAVGESYGARGVCEQEVLAESKAGAG